MTENLGSLIQEPKYIRLTKFNFDIIFLDDRTKIFL